MTQATSDPPTIDERLKALEERVDELAEQVRLYLQARYRALCQERGPLEDLQPAKKGRTVRSVQYEQNRDEFRGDVGKTGDKSGSIR